MRTETTEPGDTSRDEAANGGARGRSGYAVDAVNRAIDILSVFSVAKPSLTLNNIVSATGLPKTTTFRILSTLVDRGLCERDPKAQTYSLGYHVLHLGEVRRRQSNLRDVALPLMREIRDAIGETVVLSVRQGDFRVQVDYVEGVQPLRRIATPGLQAPLYAGAASRVLLAGLSDGEVDAYLHHTELTRLQRNTMTSPAALRAEITRIRKRGYAESNNEVLEGGAALAAPVKSRDGTTLGVVDIITPEVRYTRAHRESCVRLLLEGVRSLAARL
jgi:DNA-binding IclR family transcriptional regulator